MDRHGAMIDERWLRRFIARLVAFAALAEQAAGRSAPVRWLVLWILRRAETLMEEVVFDVTGAPPPALQGMAAIGNAPDDALRLAARFIALAETLAALLAFAFALDHRPARPAFTGGSAAPDCGRASSAWRPRPIDTS